MYTADICKYIQEKGSNATLQIFTNIFKRKEVMLHCGYYRKKADYPAVQNFS